MLCQDPPHLRPLSPRSYRMRLTSRQALRVYAAPCSFKLTTSTPLKRGSRPRPLPDVSPLGGLWRSGQPAGCSPFAVTACATIRCTTRLFSIGKSKTFRGRERHHQPETALVYSLLEYFIMYARNNHSTSAVMVFFPSQ